MVGAWAGGSPWAWSGGRRVAHLARRGITILAALAVAAVGFVAQVPSPAAATIDPVVYQGVYAGFGAVNARAGGYLRCPAGRTAVAAAGFARCPAGTSVYAAGGVFTKANGELIGELSTSAPAFDGSGWQMTGVGPGGGSLIVTACCVARLRVFS